MSVAARVAQPLLSEAVGRRAERPVSPLFLERWSPRAFTDAPIPEETLLNIFEAARWAPSAYNAQPWRFVYARRGAAAWNDFVNVLLPFNQAWAKSAAALVVVLSNPSFTLPGTTEPTTLASASFDAGAAWASFSYQAHEFGWATHAMGGFSLEAAQRLVKAPVDYRVEAVVAIGKRGNPEALPETLRERERPSQRRPIGETVFVGALT